tara:strand:+ start:2146 stop:2337 length:192 start_codon:yes stop_codon:yes gene_type:complete
MNCNICDSEIEADNGDIVGYFGTDQISFCVWCMSSITDMVIQCQGFNDVCILKERIKDLEDAK